MTDSDLTAATPAPAPPQPGLARRTWLYGAVAGGATLAGLGLAWWNQAPAAKSGADLPPVWGMSFTAPDQSVVRMQVFAGKPLLLNFWATWCPPCVEELPLLDRFYAENSHNGWQVLGIAADQLAAVQSFLGRSPVRFPVALAGMEGIALSKSLGNLTGGLPFTVVLGSSGQVLHRKIGRVGPQDLLAWRTLS